MSDAKKTVVYNFIDFLKQSLNDGTIREDDKEGIEIACETLSEAFQIDLDKDASTYSLRPDSLVSLVESHLKSSKGATTKQVSEEDKERAEKLKAAGNTSVANKDYEKAIKEYTEAIELDGTNPVYWSNRAAAQSQLNKHDEAIKDAKQALALDPTFSRAYSRLGHAHFANGDYADSIDAYQEGLKLDPSSSVMASSLETAKKKLQAQQQLDTAKPSAGSSSAGSRAGPGGPPDLSAMMNDPNIMNMAEKLMSSGGLENIMNSPMFKSMMDRVQSGDMPDMSQLMNDPAMRQMAQEFGKNFKK